VFDVPLDMSGRAVVKEDFALGRKAHHSERRKHR
jgi:hypothetical protein